MDYVLKRQKATAYGFPLATSKRTRFLVKAGSTAMRHGSPSVKRKSWLTAELVFKGVLVPDVSDPDLYRFTQDQEFTSASAAGDVINDGNLSAPQYWINTTTGKSLKEDLAALP